MGKQILPPVAVVLGNEDDASQAFKDALHGREIQNLAKVKQISGLTSPQNWVTLSRAALVHAREIPASDFDPLLATTSTEFGSQLYDFSWSLCTYATIPTKRAEEVYTAMLAVAALCLGDINQLEIEDLTGRYRRARKPWADYTGPLSVLPGNRDIWTRGERGDEDDPVPKLYAERGISSPLAAWALGQSWRWTQWDHKTLGWAMDAAAPPGHTQSGHQHGYKVTLPRDPLGLVARINKLKMRGNQRLEILLLPDGGIFCLLNPSTFATRGSALVTEYVPAQKLFRLISPAEPTKNGEWTACEARLSSDRSWYVRQTGNDAKRIDGRVAEPEVHILWDKNGCQILKGAQLPDPIPEIKKAGVQYDAALRKLGDQGKADSRDREARGRTAFEVMNRIAQASRSSARKGAETLLRDMVGWVDGLPLPDTIPEIEAAGVTYDAALRKLGDQGYSDSADREARARTAFEVMNRIAQWTRPSAKRGAETLVNDMRGNGW